MNSPHDKNTERLRRIREATENAEAAASAAEPTADVITQKIVQEIAELKRQNAALTEQMEKARLEQQKQFVELDTLRSRQRKMVEHLNQQQQRAAAKPQASAVSAKAIKTYIDDKLLTLKVQLGCISLAVALIAAAVWFWPERGKPEPQQSSTTSSSISETGRPQ